MKSKGVIKFFAIALTLVCLYHLSFTFVAWNVENNAAEYADGDPELERQYLDSVANETVYDIWLQSLTYQEVKERELNLGLDLRGGMHVTLEVDVGELLLDLANHNEDPEFREALDRAYDLQRGDPGTHYVDHFQNAFEEINPEGRLANIYAHRDLRDEISPDASNEEVVEFLKEQSQDALEVTYNIISSRIDQYGVAQPNIQKEEGSDRILVELPGVDDPERVRRLLQESAELAFWETYEMEEILPYLEEANELLAEALADEEEDIEEPPEREGEDLLDEDLMEEGDAENGDQEAEEGEVAEDEAREEEADEGELEDQEDFDDFDLEDGDEEDFEEFAQEFPLYSLLQPNVQEGPDGQIFAGQGPRVGFARPRDTPQVNEYLNRDDVQALFPPDLQFRWSAHPFGEDDEFVELIGLRITRDGNPPLDGESVTDARQDFNRENQPIVSMSMNSEGARTWANLTGDNIGRSVAIVLDQQVISYPTVQTRITGGRSEITGNFSVTEAQDLANILRSGRLPLSTNIVQEAVVGPTLGEESIRNGLISLLVGILLILIFMVLYYNVSGWVANFALVANLFFIIGVLSSLGAALTLPGIAGVVLTMGMSVDANVLIFQRIREEIREGKGLRMAIADGYRNAYSAIIDANVTTLLTGIILFTFGSGPVQGFATILIIGILTSLFSALFITRLIFEWALDKDKNVSFGNKWTLNMFEDLNIDFISRRRVFYSISGGIILLGIVSLSTKGLDFGVDFKGGYSYVVRFDETLTTSEIRNQLEDNFAGNIPEVKTFGGPSQHRITTDYMIDSRAEDATEQVRAALDAGLTDLVGEDAYEVLQTQQVGATIADDIRESAQYAVVLSLLLVFLYIFIRFQRWQFGAGALLALVHDVLILFSIFSFLKGIAPFSVDVDQAFVAALLTTVGYSINDSVVVFDRIRESLSFYRKKPLLTVVNTALNRVFSRTIITSFTTMLVVLVLFIFGGEMIRGFAFALLLGVLSGTFSSIFIATPALIDLQKQKLESMREEVIREEKEKERRRQQKEKVE